MSNDILFDVMGRAFFYTSNHFFLPQVCGDPIFNNKKQYFRIDHSQGNQLARAKD